MFAKEIQKHLTHKAPQLKQQILVKKKMHPSHQISRKFIFAEIKERTLGFGDDPNKVCFIIWIYVIWSNAINSCVATSHNWRKKKAKTLGFSDDPNKVCFIIWIYVIWSNAINSCVATSHNWRKKKAKTLGSSDDPNKVCFIIWIYVIWSNFNFCGFNNLIMHVNIKQEDNWFGDPVIGV